MPHPNELDDAFHEGRRDPIDLPFVFDDAVELQHGADAGMRGTVVAVFREDSELIYTVELSTGRDIQVRPSELGLLEG